MVQFANANGIVFCRFPPIDFFFGPENVCTNVTLGGYMPHPTVKIEIPKMAVDQNTRKILGVKIPFLSYLLVSMFVVSIPFPPGMLGPTSQSTLQIMDGTQKHYHTLLYMPKIRPSAAGAFGPSLRRGDDGGGRATSVAGPMAGQIRNHRVFLMSTPD